jgi:hypothetical protein
MHRLSIRIRKAAPALIALYGASVLALLLTREKWDMPLPPPLPSEWFYFAYPVLPIIAALLPLTIVVRSRLFRFCLYIIALYFFGLAWFHQLELIPLLGLGPLDDHWVVEITNFLASWDRPFYWSFFAAGVCLGWAATERRMVRGYDPVQ